MDGGSSKQDTSLIPLFMQGGSGNFILRSEVPRSIRLVLFDGQSPLGTELSVGEFGGSADCFVK